MNENRKKIMIVVCLLVIIFGIYFLVKPYGLVKYVTDSSFEYAQAENGIILTKYTGENKNIIIPEKIDGKNVVSLSGTFYGNSSVENVIIPKGVETVDYMTFWHCINLVSVELPESVRTIGHAAFNSCISLKKIKGTFAYTHIMPYAFTNCVSLGSIDLPETLEFIGEKAFEDCESLKKIAIPSGVQIIGGITESQQTDEAGNVIVPEDQRGSTEKTVFDGCPELTITIAGDNEYYFCEDNVIKSKIG